MSGAFKFVFNPYSDYDNDVALYNYVEVSGGNVDDSLHAVFDRFVSFLEGCGYTVDKEKLGYGT